MVAYLSESPKSVALKLVLFGGTSPLGSWKDAAAYGMVPVKMWQGGSQESPDHLCPIEFHHVLGGLVCASPGIHFNCVTLAQGEG
jgi:hypothetical protein